MMRGSSTGGYIVWVRFSGSMTTSGGTARLSASKAGLACQEVTSINLERMHDAIDEGLSDAIVLCFPQVLADAEMSESQKRRSLRSRL
jgi:hypothetical protein